ncbi:MAG TPA: 5'-nucleotidase C-terminal domain-containing protein, partial [Nocardioides sp.]|nr:5'-nucleotidase C-terminal domain-containing protein [Nocardioides sp.]
AVTERPVVSAGQYGANLNSLEFEYLPGTDQLVDIRQTVLALKDYDADPATQAIVDRAVDAAAAVGNRPLGDLEGPFQRARRNDPVAQSIVENRGGESTLGNLVAEIQRWKTDADIAFMNPGGLRADLLGELGTPRVLTYRQAADVQPFANTLVTMDLTGRQIKAILEQQWQRDADGNIPSRPFLRLGTSRGFTSTYDPSRAEGERITGMWLDGEAIDLDAVYRVAATSFLASGTGDNFWGFAAATNKQDTGKTDLQAVVDYMAANAPSGAGEPLPVDYRQHQVGVEFPGTAPAAYEPGDTLSFEVSSLAMTGADDQQDSEVELLAGGSVLGRFPVTNTLSQEPDDEAGAASVSIEVPAGVQDGTTEFTLRGDTTGTTVTLPIVTSDGLPDSVVTATDTSYAYGTPGSVPVTVAPGEATGTVTLRAGDTEIGTATLDAGSARITVPADALEVGVHDLAVVYSGDAGHTGDRDTVQVTVTKAASRVTATATPAEVKVRKGTTQIVARVAANGVDPTGEISVIDGVTEIGRASVVDGRASVTLAPFTQVGTRSLTVRYLGDEHVEWSETEVLIRVVKRSPRD